MYLNEINFTMVSINMMPIKQITDSSTGANKDVNATMNMVIFSFISPAPCIFFYKA
jgi:hypothetical protein